jgi:hypothetical protein
MLSKGSLCGLNEIYKESPYHGSRHIEDAFKKELLLSSFIFSLCGPAQN